MERSTEATKRREDHQVTQGEHRRAERTGMPPERVRLADRVREARDAAQGQGREGFEAALTSAGVEYRANESKTGRMNGYSFHLPGHRDGEGKDVWMSASTLDRSLSWSKVREHLDRPRDLPVVEVPRGRFESKAKHEERTQTARAQVGQQQVFERMGQVPARVAGRDVQAATWWANRQHTDQARTVARETKATEREQQHEMIQRVRAAFPGSVREAVRGQEPSGELSAAERVRRARERGRGNERGGHER